MGRPSIRRLRGGGHARRLCVALASALGVAGCPALQDDPYSKVDGTDGASGATTDSFGGSAGQLAGAAGASGVQPGTSAGGTAPEGLGGLLDVGSGGQSLVGGTGGEVGSGGSPAAGGFEASAGGSAGIPAGGTGGVLAAGGSGVGGTTGSGGLTSSGGSGIGGTTGSGGLTSSGGSGIGGTTGSGGLTTSGGEGGSTEVGGGGGQPPTGGGAGVTTGGTGGLPTGGSAGSAGEGECGDGIVQGEEECDAGSDSVTGCTNDCTIDCSDLYSGAVAYEVEPGHLHCIYTTTMERTWDEGVERCEEDGAHLATITSDVEQAAALDALGSDTDVWIGATDGREASDATSGSYEWITDETWSYEPSEGFADHTSSMCTPDCEHCAALQDSGEWQAATCDEDRTPLCEWEPPGW